MDTADSKRTTNAIKDEEDSGCFLEMCGDSNVNVLPSSCDDGDDDNDENEAETETAQSNQGDQSQGDGTGTPASSQEEQSSAASLYDLDLIPTNTESTDSESTNQRHLQESTLSDKWTSLVKRGHQPIMVVLQFISRHSARNPKTAIAISIFAAFFLLIVGFLTNFTVDVNEEVLWTPAGSLPLAHNNWIRQESGFPGLPRYFVTFLHDEGGNVVTIKAVDRLFQALDVVRESPEYPEACLDSGYVDAFTNQVTCDLYGITRFWNHSRAIFQSQIENDDQLRIVLSSSVYPNGLPFPAEYILGNAKYDVNGTLVSAEGIVTLVNFPDTDKTRDFELQAVDKVLALREQWDGPNVEVLSNGSLPAEFIRTIESDIPLVPFVFIMMGVFTSLVFYKGDRVKSRMGLGGAAVLTVFLSIMAAFGLMFNIGVKFTPVSQLLPFVLVSIGLDDSFIVLGSFTRTDPRRSPEDRVADTIHDIGLSITLTTLTSATAFALGTISSIPAVDWLCQYCFPAILLVFVYQLTCFIPFIVLDERRIMERRKDLPYCCSKPGDEVVEYEEEEKAHIADRIMGWYAERLLHPWTKGIVIVGFLLLMAMCTVSATKLTQSFDVTDLLPTDSYAADYLKAQEEYTNSEVIEAGVYFRDVDQSNPAVRQEMAQFVQDLDNISDRFEASEFFWVAYFDFFSAFYGHAEKPFKERIRLFLDDPIFGEMFGRDIVVDEEGTVIASRTRIRMEIDLEVVQSQVEVMEGQRQVVMAQKINEGKSRFAFFTYENVYKVWEFYLRSVDELVTTTIIGVGAVTFVTFIFIPHWSAALIVFPFICILYVDLLGVMQWGGLHINALSYVSITMSIGLLVDFIMHILFRYYEVPGNRREKTVEMLKTMGASILLGGTTTFLGTLPLLFSASDVFTIVFVSFMGIATLGVGHGLVLLPVLLSMVGPEVQVSMAVSKPSRSEKSEPMTVKATSAVRSLPAAFILEGEIHI